MTYREMTERCDVFQDAAYNFGCETDVWDDFHTLFQREIDESSEPDLFENFNEDYTRLRDVIDNYGNEKPETINRAFCCLRHDCYRIHCVLKALLHLDGVYMLYKNHMEEAANNLRKESHKLLTDLYELDQLEETYETTETTTSGSPA